MDNSKLKNIAINLVQAETESEVVTILKNNNFYDNNDCWRAFGDNENNFSTTGNQQKS
jgi:hypothetical protein